MPTQRSLTPENTELKARVEQLEVQLAGCGVAALGGIAGRAVIAKPHSYGWSPPYQCVVDLRTQYEELIRVSKAAVNALRSYQYGNSAPALAEEIADALEKIVGSLLP